MDGINSWSIQHTQPTAESGTCRHNMISPGVGNRGSKQSWLDISLMDVPYLKILGLCYAECHVQYTTLWQKKWPSIGELNVIILYSPLEGGEGLSHWHCPVQMSARSSEFCHLTLRKVPRETGWLGLEGRGWWGGFDRQGKITIASVFAWSFVFWGPLNLHSNDDSVINNILFRGLL